MKSDEFDSAFQEQLIKPLLLRSMVTYKAGGGNPNGRLNC
jgi:hypothetical protein